MNNQLKQLTFNFQVDHFHEGLLLRKIPNETGFFAREDGTIWTTWINRGRGKRRHEWIMGDEYLPVHLSLCGKHPHVKLWTKVYHVGVVILTTFIGPCPPGLECCHGPDDNPMNNAVSNLRWDTRSANVKDRKFSKLDAEQRQAIKYAYAAGTKVAEIAILFGVSKNSIYLA